MFKYSDIRVGDILISSQGNEYKVLEAEEYPTLYYFYVKDIYSKVRHDVIAPKNSENRFGLKKHIHA